MIKLNKKQLVFSTYDRLLLVASWGWPGEYESAKYVMEVEELEEKHNVKRNILKDSDTRFSSTSAIMYLLKKHLPNLRDKIDLMIFIQDTILLRQESSGSRLERYLKTLEIERGELKKELYDILRTYSGKKVVSELEEVSNKKFNKIIRFAPGVISSFTHKGILYTWYYKGVYNLIRNFVALHVYMKLLEFDNTQKLAVIVDTTHGINYFAIAVRDGVTVATALYATRRIFDEKPLEELVIYHYNSDPFFLLGEKSIYRVTPSLKIHLLNKTFVVRSRKSSLQTLLESAFALREKIEVKPEDISFGKIMAKSKDSLLRGTIVWALRRIMNVGKIPSEEELKNMYDKIRVKFSLGKEPNIRKITYTNIQPELRFVNLLILCRILRNFAEKIKVSDEIKGIILSSIKKAIKNTSNESKDFESLLSDLENLKFMCFKFKPICKCAERFYDEPINSLVYHEFNEKENFMKKGPKWKAVTENISKLILQGKTKAIFIRKPIKAIISLDKGVDKRNYFAHAGLAYGLPWILAEVNEELILCLGKDKIDC